ncbi:MAG: nuclear transport factor 2 family protein, partial [Mycobacterium sp.]|nr:nuclear transport factor 2 family protein [Mycobacterium sp.]
DEAAGTAEGKAYYCVTQATDVLPLQVIVTGHYHDSFRRIDGRWWFDTRTMFIDQVGDTSQHLKF